MVPMTSFLSREPNAVVNVDLVVVAVAGMTKTQEERPSFAAIVVVAITSRVMASTIRL